MNLPILSYGHSILKQKCEDIQINYPDLENLVVNMWDTLYNADGCGLAAPQIGKSIRLFIVDSKSTFDSLQADTKEVYFELGDTGIVEIFINARIIERYGDIVEDEEGCLSIPNVWQRVKRPWFIKIDYLDKNFERKTRTFGGYTARLIQHEYDHTEGILYVDHLNSLTRQLLAGKLKKVSKGLLPAKYPMIYKK